MKKYMLLLASIITLSFTKDCHIMNSPIDLNKMNFGYQNWHSRVVPIVGGKDFKYTSFSDAYKEYEKSVYDSIKESVCKNNGWDGVVSYKIDWQQTDKTYNFIATYDTFQYK